MHILMARAEVMKRVSMTSRQCGQPDAIGKIAVLLASDETYWITGQLLQAAGGVTL